MPGVRACVVTLLSGAAVLGAAGAAAGHPAPPEGTTAARGGTAIGEYANRILRVHDRAAPRGVIDERDLPRVRPGDRQTVRGYLALNRGRPVRRVDLVRIIRRYDRSPRDGRLNVDELNRHAVAVQRAAPPEDVEPAVQP
jgi:hypothetical protein